MDSEDPERDATFWQEALGWRRTYAEPDEVVLEPPQGSPQDGVSPDILFLRVPEDKAVKNRLHLDLRPEDQAAEVERLEGLGARRSDVGRGVPAASMQSPMVGEPASSPSWTATVSARLSGSVNRSHRCRLAT